MRKGHEKRAWDKVMGTGKFGKGMDKSMGKGMGHVYVASVSYGEREWDKGMRKCMV